MNKLEDDWLQDKCSEMETSFKRNNSKTTFEPIKEVTKQKQSKVATIQDKNGKCLSESEETTNRWTEYCRELYNLSTCTVNSY